MASQIFLLLTLLSISTLLPPIWAFTVIMSDTGMPLLDTPQTGFSMNKNGARTDAQEQEAVYDIMKATGNEWAMDIPDVCRGRWHGIECMPDKDNVYHVVSLSFGTLSDDTAFPTCHPTRSYISSSVTKLPHLRTLFFYRCLSYNPQPIPSFLGHLGPTLQTLVLRENGHVGPIPNALGNLSRLKVLDLHKNNLNGSIPVFFGNLTGLRSLDLSGNRLSGSIPNLSLPFLNVLDLNQNLLIGSIPPNLGSCQSLIKVDFSRNHLTGPIPDSINILKDLILVDLSYNRLSGPLPLFQNLTSLHALILKGNFMGLTIIPSEMFDNMKSLMILILSNMNLHGSIPESIGRLPNLQVLHLDGNQLNGSIPLSFRGLNHLSELRLNDNQLTGPIPFGREIVWRMKRKLRIKNNVGLCYDTNSGFEEGLDPTFDSGIGLCDAPRPSSDRQIQHLSIIDGGVPRSINQSSNAIVESSNLLRFLLQLILYMLFHFNFNLRI